MPKHTNVPARPWSACGHWENALQRFLCEGQEVVDVGAGEQAFTRGLGSKTRAPSLGLTFSEYSGNPF